MMLPGITISPPNFLTPSRLPRLSRPLRDEPPAFLCAIGRSFLAPRAGCASDLRDAQHGLLLAMTFLAAVIVAPLLFEDDDLVRPPLLDDGGANRSTVEQRRTSRHFDAFADHQHFGELDRRAGLGCKLLDRNNIVLCDFVLLAASTDHCEHDNVNSVLAPRFRPKTRVHPRRGDPREEQRNIGASAGLSTHWPGRPVALTPPNPIFRLNKP